ncbi:hypothetical protein ARMGADRAFT_1074986 [Armillaria gallica]|uniref:Uncharacterized protein n=1 Tax=Armillaria gallica TaxID=47427 RepID=A0A2H3EC86_ARMGA|nr:hypothetical protein ARMGADRAFT_1074986 [Armillaria gallica]
MKADSDFDEDDGDQDTMGIDAAPVPPMAEPTWPDYSSTSIRGAAFSSPSFTRPLGSGFPTGIVITNGINLSLESPSGVSQAQWNRDVYPPKSMYRFAVKVRTQLTPGNIISEASMTSTPIWSVVIQIEVNAFTPTLLSDSSKHQQSSLHKNDVCTFIYEQHVCTPPRVSMMCP